MALLGYGGPTGGNAVYWVRSTTNLGLPLSEWSVVATNVFNADGTFSNSLPVDSGNPQQFYRLQMP